MKYLHVKISVSIATEMFENMTERFPEFDGNEIQELKENAENQNTKKSTKTWVSVWLSYEAKQLDEKLEKFFAEERKKDGSENS